MTRPREVTEEELSVITEHLRLEGGDLFWKKTISPCGVRVGDRAGSKKGGGYRYVKLNKTQYQEHRVIYYLHTGVWPRELQVDHINGVKDDNRPDNLRLVSNKENSRSYRSPTPGASSKYRGVSYNSAGGKWFSTITEGARRKYLGAFDQEREAALVWNLKAVELGYNPEAYNQVYGD